MKILPATLILLIGMSAWGGAPASRTVVFELHDGSKVIGTLKQKRLKLSNKACGEVSFPLASIVSGKRREKRGLQLKLHEGDTISGELVDEVYEVQTIIGIIKVKPDQIRRIWVRSLSTGDPDESTDT